jgi:hypothetical protein
MRLDRIAIPTIPAARVLPRRSSAAVIGEQRTASDDLGKQKLTMTEASGSDSVRCIVFQKEIHASRSMMAITVVQSIHPQIPLTLALPCRNVKLGNAVTPNFAGGVLKLPIFKSLISPH